MAPTARRVRQYVGIALIVLAYVGGIFGWSWAVWTIDVDTPDRESPSTTVVEDSIRGQTVQRGASVLNPQSGIEESPIRVV